MLGSHKAYALCGAIAAVAIASSALLATPAPAQDTAALPDGEGAFTTEAQCGYCHDATLINRSMGYTREHWEEFVSHMAPSDPSTQNQILDYLAEHFPPSHNQRAGTQAPGALQVSFQNWIATTPGQGLRGAAQAPDGSIWYVGQRGNTIGRVMPATGDRRDWTLPENAAPEGVAIDAQGGVWYTGNGGNTIGRWDPETARASEYRISDANARGPYAAEFDAHGIMWFTLESGNRIGRFDPATQQMRFATIATANARPNGIRIAPNGAVWASCGGANCLISVNPQTMAVTEIALPQGATARRLDIASDGAVWYTNQAQGKIGRYDPATRQTREWASPSGANAQPYAIAVINGVVWYNESNIRPDMLVRFDPRTEAFQSWPIQSGNIQAGMARNMRATRDGNLLLTQDATNRVIVVTLPPAG